MDFIDVGFIIFFIVINIARLLVNARIYRIEYDSDTQMDDIGQDFSVHETQRKDETGILFMLSLFTLLWLNYAKPQNKSKVFASNVLSLVFLTVLAVYFMLIN